MRRRTPLPPALLHEPFLVRDALALGISREVLRGGSLSTVRGAAASPVAPITATAGNVGVAFAALSYSGRLGVSVIVDPDVVPEAAALGAALRAELALLATADVKGRWPGR